MEECGIGRRKGWREGGEGGGRRAAKEGERRPEMANVAEN